MSSWVDLAQVASGLAALAAVVLSVSTIRSARRVPLTNAYMEGWQGILDVLVIACENRDSPPPVDESDQLMRKFKAADHRLSVVEATVGARVYGGTIRLDLNNLLIDTLYDDPDIRTVGVRPLTTTDLPKDEWADGSDEDWERVINSVPFTCILANHMWGIPGKTDDYDGLMRWYYPVVLQGLRYPGWASSPDTSAQRQLASLLNAYVNSFVLPWVRDASREVLMGRVGWRNRMLLVRDNLTHWIRRERKRDSHAQTLFRSTQPR